MKGTRRLAVTVGFRAGSLTAGWSVDTGETLVVARSNRGGTGSTSVTVQGSGFGQQALTGMLRLGETSCEVTEWESDTSVRCQVADRVRGTRRVSLTAGERAGSVTAIFSTDTEILSVLRRGNRAGTGSTSVTVHGSHMGLTAFTGRAAVGNSMCEGTVWESATSLTCLLGGAGRGTQRVSVTVGGRVASVTASWSTDSGTMSVITRVNLGGTGSASIMVHGTNIGLSAYSAESAVGRSSCEGTEWESETSVRCLVGESVRVTRRVLMTVGETVGSVTAMLSVDIGTVSMTTRTNLMGTGSTSVTVHGMGIGNGLFSSRAAAGHSMCEGTEWQSDSSVVCKAGAGSGGSLRLAVTVANRAGTLSVAGTYDVATMTGIALLNQQSGGHSSVTVTGTGLGAVGFCQRLSTGSTGCEGTEWVSESSISCKASGGLGRSMRGVMSLGSQVGSVSDAGTYDGGRIWTVLLGNQRSPGQGSMTVSGSDLGLTGYSVGGRAGDT
eukprot:2737824-Rhodomonas_salina.1